jgi:Eco57I restriction-modification methylase/N-6 DNA methylase
MARKPVTDISAWPSLTLEGNLIAPALIASIDLKQASEQTEADYRIRKGLTIREEISTAFRVGQSHFDAFAKLENPSIEATRRFVRPFLAETFGFDDLTPAGGVISFLAGGRVPVVVVPPSDEKLDRRSPTISTDRSRSAAFALQDYLNDSDHALWGLVTNGAVLRLMRDNASLTRPAYIEADLVQIFTNEDAASFAVLWSLFHRTRFGIAGTPATDCALERWREAGSREGEAARDRLAAQVETALKALGSGFLEANPDLAVRLKSGEVNLTEWFNELLRLVYRLIFLMVAEDRNLLHPEKARPETRKLYAEGYSLAALRAQCVRAATWDKHHDRYEGIKIVFRALAHGQPALGLPALGGLFGAGMLPHLETARLRNRAFMEALYRLSWLSDKTSMVPVNWRAMETEELGSVYESLLELQPQLGEDGRTLIFASEIAEQKGNQRKTTGSYYTPDSLVQALLDTALDPVLDETQADAADPTGALLKLSVIDPACGSGHFLLAAARRIATRLARIRAEGTPSLADFRHALRDVARCCVYGVDRNPMAVELTKVALWIETVDPGLPLGFFDAQIRCGDALLGIFDLNMLEEGIPDAAYKPLTGDSKEVARHYAQKNKRENAEKDEITKGFGFSQARDLMRDFAELRAMPETTLAAIEAKAARLKALTGEGAAGWTLARACDLYVAAFLLPKRAGGKYAGPDGLPGRGTETVPTSGTIWEWLRGVKPFGPLFGAALEAVGAARALHWPLEFPDVMANGGFDVVLGNPPWERIKLQEQEFFATRSPEIAAAPNKAVREKLIKALGEALEGSVERALSDAFVAAKREAEATSEFVRVPADEGGRFVLTGRGDVNTYALFAELFASLGRGRAGVIVPTGIATDATTAPFFSTLIQERQLASLFDFENRELIFPHVYYRVKFCLLTLGRNEPEMRFAFFLTDPAHLAEPERNFTLSLEAIAGINPNTKTAPVFRSRADAELTEKIYAQVPVLIEERPQAKKGGDINPWGITFQTMFHMSGDSHVFSTGAQLEAAGCVRDRMDWVDKDACLSLPARYVPLYEAKLTSYYDHRASGYGSRTDERGFRVLPETTIQEHQDPYYEPEPFYWVPQDELEARLSEKSRRGWLLGWKDVTSVTNERTAIFCVIPRVAVGHTMPLLFTKETDAKTLALYANLNSLVCDYVAKNKVAGLHLTYGYLRQLPILPPGFYTSDRLTFVTIRVLELTYTSHCMAPFARDLGHDGPPFAWDEDRRAALRADLDAFYARAYGLDRDEMRYILDPADVKGVDYPSETFRVLKDKEVRQFGEFRHRRLVLEAWDRLEVDGTFAKLGLRDASRAVVVPAFVELPPLDSLPSGAWAWPTSVQPRDRLRYAAQYALWQMDPTTDGTRVRFFIASLAEPALLTPWLVDGERSQWIRLMGAEAQPAQGTIRLRPAINAAWRSTFETLLTSGQIEESNDATWARGQHFSSAGLQATSVDAQRAAFAARAIRSMDVRSLSAAVAPEDNVIWARFGSGHST